MYRSRKLHIIDIKFPNDLPKLLFRIEEITFLKYLIYKFLLYDLLILYHKYNKFLKLKK